VTVLRYGRNSGRVCCAIDFLQRIRGSNYIKGSVKQSTTMAKSSFKQEHPLGMMLLVNIYLLSIVHSLYKYVFWEFPGTAIVFQPLVISFLG
jgi:hypothetical protein